MRVVHFCLTLGLVRGMETNGTNENINIENRGSERNPFEIFHFGLGVVGQAVGVGVGAVGGAVNVVGGVVGGALDAVGSLPRNIPPLPNPFVGQNNNIVASENAIDRTLDADNETLAEEPVNQFCGKDPVKQSLEEVLSRIASLSEFLKVYNYSNVTFSSDFNLQTSTVLAPNNQAINKLSQDTAERLATDEDFAKQFVLRHTITGPTCCRDIVRNSGPFFNSNRKTSQAGGFITLRRSVSGGLYADKSEIDRSLCNTVFDKGTLLSINRALGF